MRRTSPQRSVTVRVLVIVLPLIAALPCRAGYLYGVVDGLGQVVRIDPQTGQGTLVYDLPYQYQGLEAIEPLGGNDYIVVGDDLNNSTSGHNDLLRVNPVNMSAETLFSAPDFLFIEGMARIGEALYGSASTISSDCVDCADTLVRIDPIAMTVTPIGGFGPEFRNVEALAYSSQYGLIGASIGVLRQEGTTFPDFLTTPALILIDPTTGASTKIADLPPSSIQLVPDPSGQYLSPLGPYILGMTFAPDGTLYGTIVPTHFGGPTTLVRIDPTTGAIFEIGPVGYDLVDGLAWVVPEPGGAWLLSVGGILVAGVSRHRRRARRATLQSDDPRGQLRTPSAQRRP